MMKIDIERLIDAVAAENEAYSEYCISTKNLYKGDFDKLPERKAHLEYAREVHDREQSAVYTIIEIFELDAEAQRRLYACARAVNRWRAATNWAILMPDNMKEQIKRFIFGEPAAPNLVCAHCGCWRA